MGKSICDTYMLFAGWEVRIVKNCDRGLENAVRGHRLVWLYSFGILGDQLLSNAKQKKHIKMLCWFHCAMKQSIKPVPLFCVRQTNAARKTTVFFAYVISRKTKQNLVKKRQAVI